MNIKDFSKKLNLSITTVSRALGGYSDVSEKTRERIIKLAKKYNYSPNPNASMLASGGDTIQAIADIGNADFSGIATKFKGVVQELNSMGTDVEVTSMLQNLALVSAGTAIDITGAKIAASTTNLSTTVKTMFEGATINLKTGRGTEFEGYVEELAANVVTSTQKA